MRAAAIKTGGESQAYSLAAHGGGGAWELAVMHFWRGFLSSAKAANQKEEDSFLYLPASHRSAMQRLALLYTAAAAFTCKQQVVHGDDSFALRGLLPRDALVPERQRVVF